MLVYYNLTFSSAQAGVRRSNSVQLRPDIVVRVRRPDDGAAGDTMHVLDAKLRIERAADAGTTFKWSDVAKMHAYRDALPAVRTAFVLYPGEEAERFEVEGRAAGAVGAIPLVPGQDAAHLRDHLRSCVLSVA